MSLNVRTEGAGPPLLLLHGFTGTAASWERCIDAWSADHRTIAPDLLGHGGSDAPSDAAAYTLERQADGLAELLTLLDAVPAAVVGYSLGARLALVLALRHPRLLDRLVLESPSAGITEQVVRDERQAADERLADDLECDGLEAFVDRWQVMPLFASHASLPVTTRAALRAERLRHDPRGLAASLRGAGQGSMTPLLGQLGEISAPTLVIAGALDPTGLERARTVAAGIPRARLEVIGESGHTPHLERPDEFVRLATDHLRVDHAKPAGGTHGH